jgi:type I restriction enzyme S subunit
MSADWKEYKLGDVTQWSSGGTPSKSNDAFWGGDIPWVSATSMKGNRFSDSSLKITEAGLRSGSRLAKRDSILLLVRGSTLHQRILVGITERDVAFNQDVKAIVPNEEFLDSWYLLFWFMSIEKDLLNMVENTGIGAGKLDTKLLQNLIIKIPPKEEREKIKACAKAIDDKLVLNNQTNQTLEHIAQAIFKSWFVDFEPTRAKIAAKQIAQARQDSERSAALKAALFADDRWSEAVAAAIAEGDPERAAMAAISGKSLDELDQLSPEQQTQLLTTAALFPDALVDSELGEIPEGWEASTLGEHFNVVMGQSPNGDTYNEEGEGIVFFQGRRDFGFRYPTPRVYTTAPKRLAQAGDTLISVRAPVGDRNMANQECCLGRGVGGIRHKTGARSFTYAFIGHIEKNLSNSGSDGTVFNSINKNELNGVSFVTPSNELLKLYEDSVESIDQRIEVNAIEIETLEQIRDSLLPKLLSGELEACEGEAA